MQQPPVSYRRSSLELRSLACEQPGAVTHKDHGCLQSDLGPSSARVAQELVDQTTRVRQSWTLDYLLKTSPSPNDTCLSIVKLKGV